MASLDTWPRIRVVLDAALELAPAERKAFVASACQDSNLVRQVFSLLAAYEEDSTFLERPFAAGLSSEPETLAGERIGPYRLLEKKGEGGMGAVYLATRADDSFAKTVAVKLLKRGWGGAEEARRFRVERQILADLEHPNIAKLLDGGSTPHGQPFFVMEYVEGQPLDDYCEQRGLSIDERLELFLEVCGAVQFAHQNLIVHRDLKPGNILVDAEGRPRLLDFGIAKILSPDLFAEPIEETAAGISPMTPQYASPEQIRGEAISTASDVYSLGVILYRLLTGLPPYRFDSRDLKAVVAAVCDQEVLPPSERLRREAGTARRRGLAGDLDAIVLQALAKNPAGRYATAEQLADDLERYLQRQPVRARGDAFTYRAGKFLQRHRLALGSALLVFLILVGSVLALVSKQKDLIAERNRVVSERNRAATVSGWLVELFGLPDPGRALGEKVTARELLDHGNATIRSRLANQPELLATLLGTLGETYANLGQLPEARDLLSSSIRYLRETGAGDAALAETLRRLGDAQRQQGKLLPARKTTTAALLHAERAFGAEHALVVRCRTLLGHIEQQLGNLDAAAERFDEALAVARRLQNQEALAELLEYRAELLAARGDNGGAYASYQEALQIQRLLRDPAHPQIAMLEAKLASILVHTEPLRAETELRAKLAQQRKLYGDAHPFLVGTLGNLGLALLDQGRLDESEATFREALAMVRALYGERHGDLAALLNNLGTIASKRGDYDAAERSYREAIEILRREKGERNPTYALYCHYLGQLELNRGRVEEARQLTEKALEITTATIGNENLQTLFLLSNLAEIRRREGRQEEGRDLLVRAVALGRKSAAWSAQLRAALHALGIAEYDLGHLEAARAAFTEVASTTGYDPILGPWSATYLTLLENKAGHLPEAEKWARQALAGYEQQGQGGGDWARATRRDLATILRAQGRLDEARQELERCLADLAAAGSGESSLAVKVEKELAEIDAAQAAAGKAAEPGRRKDS